MNIVKHEWPHNWPTFISDIVGASKTNKSLCQNNMTILKLLRFASLLTFSWEAFACWWMSVVGRVKSNSVLPFSGIIFDPVLLKTLSPVLFI